MSVEVDMQGLVQLVDSINKQSPVDTDLYEAQLQQAQHNAKNINGSSNKGNKLRGAMEVQSIIYANILSDSQVMVMVTKLAAGFLIGENGSSMRACNEKCDVGTMSWDSEVESLNSFGTLGVRLFFISGPPKNMCEAVKVIQEVVQRYKDLTEGNHKDEVVSKKQEVCGIEFEYKPPPIHVMPLAARTVQFSNMKPSLYGQMKAAIYGMDSSPRTEQKSDSRSLDDRPSCEVMMPMKQLDISYSLQPQQCYPPPMMQFVPLTDLRLMSIPQAGQVVPPQSIHQPVYVMYPPQGVNHYSNPYIWNSHNNAQITSMYPPQW